MNNNTRMIIGIGLLFALIASAISVTIPGMSTSSNPVLVEPQVKVADHLNNPVIPTTYMEENEVEEVFEGYYAEPVVYAQPEISIDTGYPDVSGVGGAADIIVKSMSISPTAPTAYQSITITATLTNYGEVAASGFSVEFKSQYGNANISLGTVWIDVLEPETSTTVYKTTNKLGPGYHTVMVVADSTNSVPESNEKNNIKSAVQWFTAPDLVVEKTWIVDTYGSTTTTITSGQPFKVYTTVKNAGDANAAGTFYTKIFVDGKLYGTKTTSGLGVGSSFSFSSSTVYVSEPGSHTVRVVIDTTYVVSEANKATGTYIGTGESNNDPTISFQVVKAKWTVLFYYDGDNNLDQYMVEDFMDVASVGSTRDVSIVVQIDHASSGAYRYFVTKGMSPTSQNALMSLGEVNMGDRDTWIGFLIWGAQRFQGEHYLVNPENHGGSWLGCCWDDTNGGDNLDLIEIANGVEALKQFSGHNVDVLYFDDCLMGAIEVLAQVYPYVDYVVASETVGWTSSFPQNRIVGAIVGNPGISGAALATTIINVATPVDDASYTTQAIAAYSASAVPGLVSAVDSFASALISELSKDKENITKARNACGVIFDSTGYNTVDLYQFAENIQKYANSSSLKSAAANVMSQVSSTVMVYRATPSVSFCKGISIYFPSGCASCVSGYASSGVFTEQTQWDEFLQAFNSKQTPSKAPEIAMAVDSSRKLFL
ncbi:MAG: clostripain-related cysteine peptidase [Thermoplasmata archaeon]